MEGDEVMSINRVVGILMTRDGMTSTEAVDLIEETREIILSSGIEEADDIIMDMLGLEPDYLEDILGF